MEPSQFAALLEHHRKHPETLSPKNGQEGSSLKKRTMQQVEDTTSQKATNVSQIEHLRWQSNGRSPPDDRAVAHQGLTLSPIPPLPHNNSIAIPPLGSLKRSRELVGTRGTAREARERGPVLAPLVGNPAPRPIHQQAPRSGVQPRPTDIQSHTAGEAKFHHHRLPASASTNLGQRHNRGRAGPAVVTRPLSPEETAGRWNVAVDRQRLPGAGVTIELWPPSTQRPKRLGIAG